jgi:hypothetical protein
VLLDKYSTDNSSKYGMNETHQLLVYAEHINLSANTNTVIKNTEALLDVSSEFGLEVNAEETKYRHDMFMSHHQNARQNSNTNLTNTSS